jgi:hypothetical protein
VRPIEEERVTGFIGWITTYGSIVGFFVQMAFYIVVAIAAAWAAWTFARYVSYMTGDEVEVLEAESPDDEMPVDEFVE